MPPDFFLHASRAGLKQSKAIGAQIVGMNRRDFFDRIGRPHADDRILGVEARDECPKEFRLTQNLPDDLIGSSDRPAVTSRQLP